MSSNLSQQRKSSAIADVKNPRARRDDRICNEERTCGDWLRELVASRSDKCR